ncbi:hypothetical protein C3920_05495, partial [Novacetimonas pomaceti]
QIAHVSSVKVPVLSPSSIPTIWEEIQDLTGPNTQLTRDVTLSIGWYASQWRCVIPCALLSVFLNVAADSLGRIGCICAAPVASSSKTSP